MTTAVSFLVRATVATVMLVAISSAPAFAHGPAHGQPAHRLTLTQRFCAHILNQTTMTPTLTQILVREDLAHTAKIDVTLGSATALRRPTVVSCAFVDSNGNAVRDGEPIQARLQRVRVDDENQLHFRRQLTADPTSSVCVLSIVLNQSRRPQTLISDTTCVVNPAAVVPESPVVALLGLTGLGTLTLVGVRRRRTASA
jgi:hypothetical protein